MKFNLCRAFGERITAKYDKYPGLRCSR